jgi:hypothetical protein
VQKSDHQSHPYNHINNLDFAASNLTSNQVQRLLTNSGDASATLLGLLGDLEVIKSNKDGSNQATGSILVSLGGSTTSVMREKKVESTVRSRPLEKLGNGSCKL